MKGKKWIFAMILALIVSLMLVPAAFAEGEDPSGDTSDGGSSTTVSDNSVGDSTVSDDSTSVVDGNNGTGNDGADNDGTGNGNTDDSSIEGSSNEGDSNEGSSNEGDSNEGDSNEGDSNEGNSNEGNSNEDEAPAEEGQSAPPYTVEFTLGENQYVMDGNTTVDMTEILGALGIQGEVADAVGTADSLFAPAKGEDGKWIVSANSAFQSTQGMTVTMADGTVYDIIVTDDASGTIILLVDADTNKTYVSINDAITSNVTHIVLQDDMWESVVVGEGKTVTIDLNGHTITNNGDHTITVKKGGSLTIVDNSEEKTGKVDNVTHQKAALYNYGTAVLNGGTFTRSKEQGNTNSFYVILNETGDLTINAASVINTSTFSTAIESKSNDNDDPVKLTINKGAVISNNFTAVKNGYIGELIITGGEINGNNGNKAVQTYGTTTISGKAVLNGDVEATDWTANDTYFPELTIAGGTINGNVRANALKHNGQVGTDAKVVITGGKINGTVKKTYQETTIVEQTPDYANAQITVSGGSFSSEVPAAFCADDLKVVDNGDGTYGVAPKDYVVQVLDSSNAVTGQYETLQEAINAAQNGNTVKLLRDTTGYVKILKDLTLTLDLNGFTLNGVTNTAVTETLALRADAGKVTVKNGTIKGKVNAWDACEMTFAADVTIENTALGDNSCWGISVYGAGTYGETGCKTPKVIFNGKIRTIGKGSGIATNGSDKSQPVIIINEGAEITSDGVAIYQPSGNVTIYGGTITGKDLAIGIKAGTLIIEGGTIRATGVNSTPVEGYSNGINASGAAIQIESNKNYKAGIVNIEIYGGEIISENCYAIYEYANTINNVADACKVENLSISDGYFEGGFCFSEAMSNAEVATVSGGVFDDETVMPYVNREEAAIAEVGSMIFVGAPDQSENTELAGKTVNVIHVPDDAEINLPEGTTIVNNTDKDIVVNGIIVKVGESYTVPVFRGFYEAPAKYFVIEGADQEWTKGGEKGVEIRLNSNKVVKVLIDGEEVEFTVEEDGTVTIAAEILNALEAGEHEITFIFADGQCSTSVFVLA